MTQVHKPLESEAYILRESKENPEGEPHCIGFLSARRTDDGELLEMFIELLPGEAEGLVGDNLLSFEKIGDRFYRWADFEGYDSPEDILLEGDESHPSSGWADFQRVLEEAENTIRLVAQGKPIQEQVRDSKTGQLRILNNARLSQHRPVRRYLARKKVGADCDVSIDAKYLKAKLKTLPNEFRSRAKVKLYAVTTGLMLEFTRGRTKRKRYQCRAKGAWKKKTGIEMLASSFLHIIKSTDEPLVRLTHIAGRLFVNHATIAAKDTSI